jgi:hypothetical protein
MASQQLFRMLWKTLPLFNEDSDAGSGIFISTLGWPVNDLVLRRELINQIEGRMEHFMEVA